MESLHDFDAVHWDHEPLAVPRRTESADESDALQTLRAGQVSGRRVSVWSACVFSAAFPRQAAIRCPGMVHGEPSFVFSNALGSWTFGSHGDVVECGSALALSVWWR